MAGSGDQQIHALLAQHALLGPDRDSAVDRADAQPGEARVDAAVLLDLGGVGLGGAHIGDRTLDRIDSGAERLVLALIESEIDKLGREYADLEEIWKSEKSEVQGSQSIKETLEKLKLEREAARRKGDWQRMSELHGEFLLEAVIPKQFGDWREDTSGAGGVVNPQQEQLLKQLYSQILTRTYVNPQGQRVVLSIGRDDLGDEGIRK